MVISINQVRQLYVAKDLKANTAALTTAGDIVPKADTAKTTLYFQYMSPAGIVSSDKIDIANIMYAKATSSDALAHKLVRYSVTLDADVADAPVAGQNYILRLAFRQYIGLSEEDQYFKYGEVIARSGMTASDFYKKMAISLAKNLENKIESTPLVNIYLISAAASTDVPVTSATKESDLTATDYNQIIIEETEQPWVLGMMPQAFIPFTPQSLTITVDGEERLWAKAEVVTPKNTVPDGHLMADLEYFCMGARGDIYRGMGYPNIIKTTYLADPDAIYDTLDIHYFYTGSNESVQKSEKTITLIAVNDGSHTAMNALIGAINTASGLTIATLS
nr:MAG TPA: Structural protein [Crassvirales sp.]